MFNENNYGINKFVGRVEISNSTRAQFTRIQHIQHNNMYLLLQMMLTNYIIQLQNGNLCKFLNPMVIIRYIWTNISYYYYYTIAFTNKFSVLKLKCLYVCVQVQCLYRILAK